MTVQQTTARRRASPIYLLWLLVPLLLWWALRDVPFGEIGRNLASLSLLQIALLIGINGVVVLTFSGRWWMILHALDYRIAYLTIARYRLAAFSVSYFTPGPHFGGEPLAISLLRTRHQMPTTTAAASVALDKLIELIVNFSFLLAGIILTLQSQILDISLGGSAILASAGLLLLPLAYLAALWKGSGIIAGVARTAMRFGLSERLAQAAARVESQASALCRERPWHLLGALLFSLLSWAGLIAEYRLAYAYLGLPLSLASLIGLLTAARIAILLPVPGGLGTFEASQVWMLARLGLPAPIGLSLSVLAHARDLAFGGLGLLFAGYGLRRWNNSRK